MVRRLYIVFGMLVGTVVSTMAAVVYRCDFEQASERQQWVRTVYRTSISGDRASAESCESKWYIGRPGQFEFQSTGTNGLYISSDADSARAVYTANSQGGYRVLCYRDMSLQEGHYTMIFSWRARGYEAGARLYVYWVPQTTDVWSDPASSQVIPLWGRNGGMNLVTTADGCLYGEKAWQGQRLEFDITAQNGQGRLLFIWACQHDTPVPPSACIDDIVLYSGAPACDALPATFAARRDEGCAWSVKKGVTYDLMAVNSITGEILDTTITVSGNSGQWQPQVPETGYYYFYIRVRNPQTGEYTEWKRTGTLMHIPQDGCIDYLALSDRTKTHCYTGTATAGAYSAWMVETGPIEAPGDEAYKSELSRHTVHYDPEEVDPRTVCVENGVTYSLPTVPPGEFASVRLGNWQTGSQAEGIMYELDVEKNATEIMVLKYAPVLQHKSSHSAGGGEYDPHGADEQSHFYVTFLDQNAQIQREGCYTFNFSASPRTGDNTWHLTPEVQGENADLGNAYWKEWTEVHISLMEYVGQHIYLQLSTYDCTATGHYGYAYFNIGCRSGQLVGLDCEDFDNDQFEAPEGFQYRWYRQDNPNRTLSTDRVFQIPDNDTLLYYVYVYSADRDSCGYTLTANPNPISPRAQVDRLSQSVSDCRTTVVLTNRSDVYRINRQTRRPMYREAEETLSDVVWDWGDGTVESNSAARVQHVYDRSGEYDVRVSAYYGGEAGCHNDTVLHFSVVLGHDLDTVVYRCAGEKYYDKQLRQVFETDTVAVDSNYVDADGCRATYRLDLRYVDEIRDTAAICRGEVYHLEGREFTESGTYTFKTATDAGCQLPVTLVLHVRDTIVAEVPDTVWVCNDDPDFSVPFRFAAGRCMGVLLHPDSAMVAAGFDTEYAQIAPSADGFLTDYPYGEFITMPRPRGGYILPNYYGMTMTCLSDSCQNYEKHIVVAVRYMTRNFLHVKRNYISLYNEHYNYGGWTYEENYAWYRNGELLPDEHRSYIQVTDADLYADFAAEVVRASDGVRMRSCSVIYGGDNASTPSVGKAPAAHLMADGRTLCVTAAHAVAVYDALGRLVLHADVDADENYVTMPTTAGFYIVLLDHAYSTRILLP